MSLEEGWQVQFARMFALEKGVVSQEYFVYFKKPQRISGTKIPQNAAGELSKGEPKKKDTAGELRCLKTII